MSTKVPKFTYLYWPVILLPAPENVPMRDEHHITAKFLGTMNTTMADLVETAKIEMDSGFEPGHLVCQLAIFGDKENAIPVVQFVQYPMHMMVAFKNLEALHPNQFDPYIPHITVTQEYWHHLSTKYGVETFSGSKIIKSIGDLQLAVAGKSYNHP